MNTYILEVTPNFFSKRTRSQSESSALNSADVNLSMLNTSNNRSILQAALNNSRANSPTVEDSVEVASSSTEKEDARKKGNFLKRCPCGSSSSGKAWLLKCNGCTQFWHNSCANLKGKIPKSTIDQLDHWLCPW